MVALVFVAVESDDSCLRWTTWTRNRAGAVAEAHLTEMKVAIQCFESEKKADAKSRQQTHLQPMLR